MIKRTDLYASLRPYAEEMQVNLGEVLFYEGDRGDCFYYVVSGLLRVLTRDSNNEMQTLGYLFPGDHCGEGALLTGKPRRATVRAVEPSTVLKISQSNFHTLVSEHRELTPYLLEQVQDIAYRNFTKFLKLDTLNLHQAIQFFFQCLDRKVIAAGEKALWQDDEAKGLYLIGRGTLQLREADQPAKRLKLGDFFVGIDDQLTIETETEVVLYTLSHIALARVLERAPQIIRVFEKTDQNEQEEPRETVPQNGRIKTIEIEPENSISDHSPRKLRTYITFPYIKQHDETDCGAACLGMICQYYGQSIGLNRLRDMANVSREGTSLSALAEAAENLGFLTRGVRIGYSEIGERDLPLIAHWEGYHFVVLYRISSKYAWIADPALGRRKISRKEFEDKWSKFALILEYTDKVSRYRGRKSSFRRFFPLARPYLGILIEIMMASLLLNLFGLASPLFTQMILDQVLVHQDTSLLNLLLLGMIIIALFRIATSSLRNYLIGYVGARISISMLSHIYHHLLRLPMRFFALRRTGEIMTRFRESQYLRSLLTETAISAVLDAVMIFVYLGLMFYYHTTLTLWVLAFIPLSIILTLIYTPILKSINQRSFLARSEWSSLLIDSLRGIEVIKTLAVEKSTRWSWEERLTQEIKIGFTAIKTNMLFGSFGQLNNVLGSTIVLWYGANLVIQGDLSVGQLIAFNMLSGRVLGPIMGLINLWPQIQLAKMGLDRLNDIYDMRTESSRNRNYSVQLTDVEGHVKFDNVFFRYGSGSTEPYVLSDINLDISPGQKVAIVGRSGAGKTTLIKLIPRLFDPTEGCVTLDETDLREFDPGWLRRQVGMVLQEPVMFNATIAENIAIGVKDVDMDRMMEVSKLAYAHDFIKDLPMGYETKIREQGVGLSGGQRQRLSIARALYGDPKILIFDEATNALDTESERAIQEGLDTMLEGKTAFIIAHRVSTVKDADLILVLDEGNIIEQGTHDTLIAEQGLYYKSIGPTIAGRVNGVSMAEAQIENPTENETDLSESTIEFLGSLHPFFSRALIYVLLLFIAISIAWAWYGQVDIVATAPFRLVPLGKVQNIQAPRSGEIQEIAIHSGDHIAEGQTLFRLRSQETLKEFRELEQAESAFKKAEFDLQQTLPQKRILTKETISALEHRVRVMQTAMQTYREALGKHTETSQTPDIEIEIHSAEVEHLKQRYEQNQKLYEKKLISLAALNEARVRYLSALAELPARMAEINRYEVSLKDLKRQILEERLELERTRANFQNAYDIAAARLKQAKQAVNRSVDADIDLILAPESGIVTQVLVNTPGQVVNKGETLVTIAPASTPIVAEALILNKDVGLLSSGQKVKLKFEAFPFQDYGIQHGYLRQISPDAMGDEGSGTVFRGIIDLENTTIFVHGEKKAFMFGMKGKAEIITDRQSILMLALNPLRQLRDIAAFSPEAKE